MEVSWWTVLMVLLGLVLLRVAKLSYEYRSSPLYGILGPYPQNPVLGSMKEVVKEEGFAPQLRWARSFGTFISFTGFLLRYRISLTDKDIVRRVMVTNEPNYPKTDTTRKILLDIVGNSLLLSGPEDHSRQRKLIAPVFAPKHLPRFIDIFESKAKQLASRWEKQLYASPSGSIEDTGSAFSGLTLDVIGLAAFDVDFEAVADSGNSNPVQQACKRIFNPSSKVWKQYLYFFLTSFAPSLSHYVSSSRSLDVAIIRKAAMDVIERRRLKREDEKPRDDLLGLIMDADERGEVSDTELVDHCMTFLVAGHETTSAALQWAVIELAKHPSVVQKMREELDGKEISYDMLRTSKYLNAVVKELLRLYPPAPMLSRVAKNDDEINGVRIPKGTLFLICLGAMHRLDDYFEDAESFKPERWLDSPSSVNAAYLPFSVGEHSCIGQRFALYELLTVIATLFTRFDFIPMESSYRRTIRVTMKPAPALSFEVRARKVKA